MNPRIGRDCMLLGQRMMVVTPRQNVKRYPAGALDARSGRRLRPAATHTRSGPFIGLLRKIGRAYPTERVIPVIVDNYSIPSSRQRQLPLASLARVRLHFLPPYCPELNPIARVWLDLHAEVTRNHRCATIDELMSEVHDHLRYRNRTQLRQRPQAVA